MKYWIFDLDGTLIDSFNSFFVAAEKIINKTLTTEERKYSVSLHSSDFFKLHLGEDKVEAAIQELHRMSQDESWVMQKFAVVEDIMIHLKEQGRHISIFTNRDHKSALENLKATGLAKYIDHLMSGDCVSETKPSPEGLYKLQKLYNCQANEMVMIGDHECDMKAGTSGGAFSIRASWHPHWQHDVCSLAHKQFHSEKDFLAWVKETI